MERRFPEYREFDLSKINQEILANWESEAVFEKSISSREGHPEYIFYEGPPSANGVPGIHHVMARTIKDVFCRYKTLKGYKVERKAGWDTHGLPVELGVEKSLGITKEDIGKKITVAEYNQHCRTDVMKYTREWEDLTRRMGYWVDMKNPYITYDNRYIETLWYLLKQLFDKNLLYKGYTIQPYSPAAGTGLSTHELNQPGCYRDVKDTTCTALFEVIRNVRSEFIFAGTDTPVYIMAWTTTPWTLPSNTALAVGADISYCRVRTFNPYTGQPITVVLAKDLVNAWFPEKNSELSFEGYKEGDKAVPFRVLDETSGAKLEGIEYHQLIDWVKPKSAAFRIVVGDFVTTEDGTGIVHIAPTFGADDFRVARQNNIPPILVDDLQKQTHPLVDKQGRFFPLDGLDPAFVNGFVNRQTYTEFAGRYVKNAYDSSLTDADSTVDVDICVMLKKQGKAFRIEKHEHPYPHCWRTDKPVLYYPLDSWFIRTTAVKDRLIALNNTINWKPESTGSGRFGKWLENLVDWNLSRSRYWGTPLPIWATADQAEIICIGSVAQLKIEIEKSVAAGLMNSNLLADYKEGDYTSENYANFDLHRPWVDQIVLVSPTGKAMYREPDLIDVWFDSGAMPYAQVHYPFQTSGNDFERQYPADFIAEGVDQTRGWFFTLHALAVMLFDSVAFRNIISNGLVLDKNGNKMSKRLGNAVDPFDTMKKYGADPLRWYMMTNSQPWDNLKFDVAGIDEVRRKFFGTLYNTYSFFALYANIDGFTGTEPQVPVESRPEIDRWVISLLHSLTMEVELAYENYEPTRAGRAIQDFVSENLSNWYVRLNRKRFWGGGWTEDKLSAFQTLYTCLETIARLASPIMPFFADRLYRDLTGNQSVHLGTFPVSEDNLIDSALEERMDIAQKYSSMILALRRKVNIKVRQPLGKIMVPVTDESFVDKFEKVKNLVLSEVNVKEVEYIRDSAGILIKRIKPDFKTLGPKYGKLMKGISSAVAAMGQEDITRFETTGNFVVEVEGQHIILLPDDVEISSEDIPGWLVANEGRHTVALDITVTDELRKEGLARELINRIQNIRKESGFEVTDKIDILYSRHTQLDDAIAIWGSFIRTQTLAESIQPADNLSNANSLETEVGEDLVIRLAVKRI